MNLIVDMWPLLTTVGEEKTMEIIKKAGFDGVDYPFYAYNPDNNFLDDDYRERAAYTKELLKKYGLICNQTHAPFGKTVYTDSMDVSHKEYEEIVRAIEYTSIIGAKHIVIHGIKPSSFWDHTAFNIKYYKSFEPYAKQFGVQVAIENLSAVMNTPELFNAVLDGLDPEWYIGLVDIGHVNVASHSISPDTFIRKVRRGRLNGLHIHDNNMKNDQHLVPYFGTIRWDYVMEALEEIGYSGDFTLEIGPSLKKMQEPDLIPNMLEFSVAVAHKMMEKIKTFHHESI